MALLTASAATQLHSVQPLKFIADSHPSTSTASLSNPVLSSFPSKSTSPQITVFPISDSSKWRRKVSFFPGFLARGRDVQKLKEELYEAIAPLDRGSDATPEDQERVDQVKYA